MVLDENPPALMFATIVSLILGIIGTGWSLLQLILTLVGGAVMGVVAGTAAAGPMSSGAFQGFYFASLAVGGTQNVLALLLSIIIVIAAILGLMRRPGPLGTASILSVVHIVVFEVVAYVIMQGVSLYLNLSGALGNAAPPEEMFGVVIGGAVGGILCMLLWAAVRMGFWIFAFVTSRRAIRDARDHEVLV